MLRLIPFAVIVTIGFIGTSFSRTSNDIFTLSRKIEYSVSIKHPGEKDTVMATLVELSKHEEANSVFYMDVESVICHLDYCKVIPVRIFWNDLGVFQGYDINNGATLEKYKDAVFSEQDYSKLSSILSDKNSPYKYVNINEIIRVVDNSTEIDAYSGETAIVLDPKDTVPGAALTCYTLWHWANNFDVIDAIQNITSTSATEDKLLRFLHSSSERYALISINQLKQRKLNPLKFLDALLYCSSKRNSLISPTITYLENTPIDQYFHAIQKVFNRGTKSQKMAAIKSLNIMGRNLSKNQLDTFCSDISLLESYPVLLSYLDVMSEHNKNSEVIISQVIPMLQKDFISSRAVYWFLVNQQLNETQHQLIAKFYEQNKERL